MSPFAPLLTRYRQRAGLGLNELGRATHCDRSHISSLESGRREPSRTMVLALAEALELGSADTDRLYWAAGYCPAWEQAIATREVVRVAS